MPAETTPEPEPVPRQTPPTAKHPEVRFIPLAIVEEAREVELMLPPVRVKPFPDRRP